ncbi:desumoylating isopeptidase 1-like [Biomphalaria glabrata]|uniref:Desumoylating isopeptidase 1-like n=1 Tax=Biomphalaria glabrata TaxID=6526 RepID=A0A9W2ZPH5_BIOGL|nr:desumoylating isopeptidase 1-like [Biomphalaria glabrata]XP_055876829.1 desumoylating isopeptidase 1-like [Biomphalaria glabrata]XP_055876830.1 desumoylating isopeptidase 1-like [Biomphalaria glabrata]
MASQTSDVKVYIYDISMGMARAMSQGILGRQINGIWHTGIVVYGQEYFFGGSSGIEACSPGGTVLGNPLEIVNLGQTEIPFDVFMDYLHELSITTYKPESYHLFHHNCNNFSSEVAQFLTGKDIPSHITSLPQEVLSTPFGAMIQPFVEAMHVQGGHSPFQ